MVAKNEARRKRFTGTVHKNVNDQTIVVNVQWWQHHILYGKLKQRITRLVAHDTQNEANKGDKVLIEETRPLSATKRWRLVKILERSVEK